MGVGGGFVKWSVGVGEGVIGRKKDGILRPNIVKFSPESRKWSPLTEVDIPLGRVGGSFILLIQGIDNVDGESCPTFLTFRAFSTTLYLRMKEGKRISPR
jgi:hypothetical protein